jgi:hypothetical protein
MTNLNRSRPRISLAAVALASAAFACMIFAHRISSVEAALQAEATGTPHAGASPVLVELFTSEGCSDCPPADALLAHLQHEQPVPAADIIVLEEHVDYWESLGWHDRFSSHQFTERQSQYVQRLRAEDDYTPQMVVDGADQFVGSDSAHALRSIAEAASNPKVPLMLSPLTSDGTRLSGSASVRSSSISVPNADFYAALVETMASTQVQRGENGGRTLNHVSIVRALQRITSPADHGSAPLKFSFAIPKDTSPDNLRVVVFLQRTGQGPVLGTVSSAQVTTGAPATAVASIRVPAVH